jgi:hypothetical protein
MCGGRDDPREIILRSVIYGLRTDIFIVQTTDDQDRDARRGQQEPIEGLKTPAVGQEQVSQDGPYSALAKSCEAAGEVLNPFDLKWARLLDQRAYFESALHQRDCLR